MTEKERWEVIEDFSNYMVSSLGRIKNIKTNRILKPYINKRKYVYIILLKNKTRHNLQLHRVVAKAFIPNPHNKPCINHKDYNPTNNKVDNLEWVTHSENCLWSSKNISMSHKGKPKTQSHKNSISKSMLKNKKKEHYIYQSKNGFLFRIRRNGIDYNKTFKTELEAIQYRDNFLKEALGYE